MNGAKATDAAALAAMVTDWVSTTWPSISSATATPDAGSGPRLETPAVTVTRSCPETIARAWVTEGTDRLEGFCEPTTTGVSVIASPNCIDSALLQPERWKSEMRIASLRGRLEPTRMLSASLRAGLKRVAPDETRAAWSAASRRPRSAVLRTCSSAS